MRRPEKHVWYFILLVGSVLTFGALGETISCARAQPPNPKDRQELGIQDSVVPPWNRQDSAHDDGRPVVSSQADVSVEARLDRSAILHEGDGIVRVEVSVETSPQGEELRRASDIVVVVDTSGSMAGEKLRFAQQALYELIARLGPDDRFGLVEYNEDARPLVPMTRVTEGKKSSFRQIVGNLEASSSTNMSAGLDRGAQMLVSPRHHERRAGRILLLSDGLANAGDSSELGLTRRARAISRNELVLTTMGIGADFDEDLMTQLATAGTGAFYYLADLSYLPEFFEGELASARRTYARSAHLRFRAAPGIRLLSAMGLPVRLREQGFEIPLGSLYAGRTRRIWLTLQVPAERLGERRLGHLSLDYSRLRQLYHVGVGQLPKIACLKDFERYYSGINESVWERALIGDVFQRTEEQFGDAIRTGDRRQLSDALSRAEREGRVARRLGNKKVIGHLDRLRVEAKKAEKAQSAPAPVRNRRAKKRKARGYQKRNSGAYDNVNRALEAY